MRPWTEKYRPQTLDDIVGLEKTILRLKNYVEEKDMPHLLFSGPAGIGKTTSALALAKEMFGDQWRDNFTELNASDERGIDVVRDKIKEFARTKPIGSAEFKIIFLDEADSLTPDAQNALRRTMEMYTDTCRFILSCNYVSKIIDPIQSRCSVFRFSPLAEKDVTSRLEHISEKEGIKLKESGEEAINYIAEGDMRRAVNLLQAASALDDEIDEDVIYDVASRTSPEDVRDLVQMALEGDFTGSRDLLEDLLIKRGLSGEDLIEQIHKEVTNLPIDEKRKIDLVSTIGEHDFRLVEGGNERIQLEALLAKMGLDK